MWVEARWRNCLETLWRTTDPPTDLFTIRPTKGAPELPALVSFGVFVFR